MSVIQKLKAMEAATSITFPSLISRTEGKRVSMTVFLKILTVNSFIPQILIKRAENTRKIGCHVPCSDDISNILCTAEDNHIALIINHAVMSPRSYWMVLPKINNTYQPQAIFWIFFPLFLYKFCTNNIGILFEVVLKFIFFLEVFWTSVNSGSGMDSNRIVGTWNSLIVTTFHYHWYLLSLAIVT